jgi:hypothetical protein
MKRMKVVGAVIAAALCAAATQASQVARESGIVAVTVTNGHQKFVSVLFARPITHAGVVDVVGSSNIVDAVGLGASTFNEAAGDNKWEFEITSGRYIGLTLPVVSNSASTVYLGGPVPAEIKQDSTYVIRKGWTLGALFGTNPVQVAANGISGAGLSGSANTIIRSYNATTQNIGSDYFFDTDVNQWHVGGAPTDRSWDRLGVNNTFIVQQKAGGPVARIMLKGEMRKTRTLFAFAGGNGTANAQALVGNPNPFAMTLATSGMYNNQGESSTTNSVTGAGASGSADKIRRINPATVLPTDYYYNTTFSQWRLGPVNSGSVELGVGEAFLLQRLSAGNFVLGVNPIFKN